MASIVWSQEQTGNCLMYVTPCRCIQMVERSDHTWRLTLGSGPDPQVIENIPNRQTAEKIAKEWWDARQPDGL